MDSTKLKAIIILVLSVFAALYLGLSAATAQMETIAWVIGGATFIICLILGRKVWLLLPFLGSLNLSFNIIGNPNTLFIAQCLFLIFSTLLILTRRIPFKFKITELEIWILLLTIMIVQVYIRNPVGLNMFGSNTVGAKPYVIFAVALCTGLLLTTLEISPKELKTYVKLSILGGLIDFFVSLAAWFTPTLGYYLNIGPLSPSANAENNLESIDPGASSRIGFLATFGDNVSRWVSIFKSPLRICIHPLWAPLILISIIAASLSGYRNAVVIVGLNLLLGLFYRGGFMHVLISALGGVTALGLLAIVNMATPLPPNIQRSLSFLPGTWDDRYVDDANGSTEWRIEIWKEVLFTDRWIQNKWIGDGLGFTARELEYQQALAEGKVNRMGISGFDMQRESILANGDYHSGPLQTIRTIGYLGFAILLLFQIRLALRAHRQIKRSRGTEWFPVSLIIGIPLVWNPFFFTFVYGTFAQSVAMILIGSGMIRILESNLPLLPYSKFLGSHQLAKEQGPN